LRYCVRGCLDTRRSLMDPRLSNVEMFRFRSLRRLSVWRAATVDDREWFERCVYRVIGYPSIRRGDLSGLRHVFALPHALLSCSINGACYVMAARFNPTPQIGVWLVNSRRQKQKQKQKQKPILLVGCLDERNSLWPTALWTKAVDGWVSAVAKNPLLSMGRFCNVCPVCGGCADLKTSWSLKCCLAYCDWACRLQRRERCRRRPPPICGRNRYRAIIKSS
jgi:hypothetical protein